MILVKEYEFLSIWEFQVSPRSKIQISRMLNPKKEKEFFLNEEYLKNLETKEQYEKESKERKKIKQDEEKFYLNAIIEGYDGNYFRTKGFSIFRFQLPQLIEVFQNIQDGKFDSHINKILNESGIIKNTVSQNNNSKANSSNLEQNNSFGLWLSNLTDRQIIEVRELQDAGWTEDEIHLAFNSKYSTT